MKRFRIVCVLVAILLPALVVQGADKKEKKAKTYPKVNSVDVAGCKVSITDTDGNTKEYVADGHTVIMVDGKPAKLADVTTDKRAEFTVAGGGTKLSRLEVTDMPVEKKKKTN